jgi:general secretion pathway protein D
MKSKTTATALIVPFLAGACSLLPPSLRRDEVIPAPVSTAPAPVSARPATDTPPAPGARTFAGTDRFINMVPPKPPVGPGPEEASLNFEAADIREVAKVILGDYLKVSYTVHPGVTGTVTFRTVKAIPMRDLLPTLELLLRQNNSAVVVEEGLYKVVPIAQVRGSVTPQIGGSSAPIPQGFSVVVVPLKFVGAREMEKLLQPFAPDNSIRVDEARHLVIMAGTQREIKHLVETIDLFDADFLAGYSVGLFPIKSADVKALVGDLDKVFGAQGSPLAGIVRVIPVERLNALFVVTTQSRYLETAKTWIDRLDQLGGTSGGSRFFVYQVRNGKAENLAQLVGDLFASRRTTTTAPTLAPGQRPTEIRSTPFGQPQPPAQTTTTTVTPPPAAAAFQIPGASGATSSEVRVIADKDTNSLLILATPGDYDVIESALKKLDVIRRQVLVEVLLAEVLLTDDLQFGIDWFIKARNNTFGTLNTMGALPPGGRVLGANNVVPSFIPGMQLINLTGDEVRAVLRTFGGEGRASILASPQIMVLDNEKAEIKVGNRISVQTQAQTGITTGTGVLNSFQYLETGILLAVTPRINSGGLVTLEVNQEVSEPTSTGTQVNPNPDVATRNAKTSLVVASGESIVLGGLIRETRRRNSDGLPLLSKIPIIGAAFGSQTFNRERTELILVVTPKIVSDTQQARSVTEELRGKLPLLKGSLPPMPTTPPPLSPLSSDPVILVPAPPPPAQPAVVPAPAPAPPPPPAAPAAGPPPGRS